MNHIVDLDKSQIDGFVNTYAIKEGINSFGPTWFRCQYDDRSASINYSLIRYFKPKVVVEFGSCTARCTHDILLALQRNEEPFIFKSYEQNDNLRAEAQENMDKYFGDDYLKIGGDIVNAADVPNDIDYLFVDNSHDLETTKWLFDVLLKKCIDGCVVQIHDVNLFGDFQISKEKGLLPETDYMVELHKQGKLPLTKMYWTWEEGEKMESSWWRYHK
mgnify:CR=1 FL=1